MIPWFTSIYQIFFLAGSIGFFMWAFPIILDIMKEERKKEKITTFFKNPTIQELKETIKIKDWKRFTKGYPSKNISHASEGSTSPNQPRQG